MEGIKTLAEGRRPSQVWDGAQVALFVVFLVSAVLVLAGHGVGEHLLTFTGAGLLFQLLTLVQPSPVIGLVLLLVIARPGLLLGTIRGYYRRR